ncbi:flocculation protein FLO11 [Folsomia candida]|uniref:flocculation protein FLO11 n=1 Tax=Folsomia candida TaxID=158441 RepID=UPI000B8F2572|nr:flocculation protein FLO11 [Folsomia candida]
MSSESTGEQRIFGESVDRSDGSGFIISNKMGVASPSAKRRLGTPNGDLDVVSAKLAKFSKNHNNNNNEFPSLAPAQEDSIAVTTDFLTTSILARTLLTSSSTIHNGPELASDPLESLKSSLEALPVPCNNGSLLTPFLKATISDADNDEFTSLLCHESSLTPVAVVNGGLRPTSSPGTDWRSVLNDDHEVITEEENGKSYFNLGSADATIVRKSSSSPMWMNVNCSTSSNIDMDDNASSSSCESLSSSEDLFNSGEEFDASDDEEEEFSSYKQQRSTVLHLSLCKLNKFRSQHCVEPSLHRSVLICNTLRHIEQEIKSEDEVDESLKSRERLPSFWRPTSNHHPHCFGSSSPPPLPSSQPLLITDSRPLLSLSSSAAPLPSTSDPYLSPNPYSTANNPLSTTRDSIISSLPGSNVVTPGQSQYLYEYSCLRPTPYHTTSYDYEHEQDLPSLDTSANSSTMLECDSGYGEELSYAYYATPPQLPPPPPPLPPTSTNSSSNQSSSQQQSSLSLLVDHTTNGSPSSTNTITSSQQFLPFTNNTATISQPLQSSPTTTTTTTAITGDSRLMSTLAGDKSEFDSSEADSDSSSGSSGESPPPPTGDEVGWNNTTSQQQSSSSKDLVVGVVSPSQSSSSLSPPFAQQDSQCGIESRRSTHLNFASNSMPMDNLISSSYSSSL